MVLYLCNGTGDMIQCREIGDYACIYSKWKHKDRLRRKIEQKLFYMGIISPAILLGKWAKQLDYYDVVVIEALASNIPLVNYVKENAAPHTRIILWHWNKIFPSSIMPNDPICEGCELWSFDPDDCKKYGMRFNTQYFDASWTKGVKPKVIRDIWFIGSDKNRAHYLKELSKQIKRLGLSAKIHVVADATSKKNDFNYKKGLTYNHALYELARSKAALDIPLQGQNGLTLRPLEAMFLGKKLITSNKSIREQPFYSANNIYIIGDDDWKRLPAMLDTEFDKSIYAALDYFEVTQWIKRFESK